MSWLPIRSPPASLVLKRIGRWWITMDELVGAFATSHVLFGSPEGDPQALNVVEGLNEIGRRIRALKPVLLVVVGSDHLFNIPPRLQPQFKAGTLDSFIPYGEFRKNVVSGMSVSARGDL